MIEAASSVWALAHGAQREAATALRFGRMKHARPPHLRLRLQLAPED
jgi:hypothetical protein